MENKPTTELPWDALKAVEDKIPWAALEQFADALVADSSLLRPLEDLYSEAWEAEGETERYEDLYVPAIFALAAPRLSDGVRREVAVFLIDQLIEAGHEGDEGGLDVLTAAVGSLGPEVLPCVLEATQKARRTEQAWACLWQLTELAVQTEDAELRAMTANACMDLLRRAEVGTVTLEDAEGAAWTLADLHCVEAVPLLQRLSKRGRKQPSHIQIMGALETLNSGRQGRPRQVWEEPVKEWLESNWREVKESYVEEETDSDEESIHDAGLKRTEALARRFAESDVAKALPPDALGDAEFIADEVLKLAWSYGQVRPEDLDEDVLREVLLTLIPRKVIGGQSLFQNVVPVTRALLSWLQSEGILENAARLSRAVSAWDRLVVQKAMDPSGWDRSKRLLVQAQREGVELRGGGGLRQPDARDNRRSQGQQAPDESGGPAVSRPAAPPDKAAKVGRNAPCPCGSGKKYKHCCGRSGAKSS